MCCVTGNAYQTVKVTDAVKIVTIRGTAFDAAATEGGSAATEEGGSLLKQDSLLHN